MENGHRNNRGIDIDNFATKVWQRAIIPTAMISALSYFIGWLANAAYYVSFGILPNAIEKPVAEILAAGWVEIVLMISIFSVAVVISNVTWRYFDDHLLMVENASGRLARLFFFFLVLSFAVGIYSMYWFVFSPISVRAIVWGILALILFWMAACIGGSIKRLVEPEDTDFVHKSFWNLYPGFSLYLAIALLALVFLCSRIGILRGVQLAERDIYARGNLPYITLYSSKSLGIPGTLNSGTRTYVYDGYKLIVRTDELLYLLGASKDISQGAKKDGFAVYAVRNDSVSYFELQR